MALTKVIGAGVGSLTEDLALSDSDKIKLGAGSDLQLYHDGSHSYIDEVGTGSLYVRASIIRWTNADGSETLGGVDADGGWFLKANNSNALVIDTNGHITKPLQPAFYAETASSQSNIALNTAQTLAFGGEIFDQNADFASNTFTAPLSGRYFLHTTLRFEAIDTAANYVLWGIVTSNREFYSILDPQRFSADVNYYSVQQTVLADMDASDTAHVVFLQSGGTQQTDLQGADGYSYFCGHLVA